MREVVCPFRFVPKHVDAGAAPAAFFGQTSWKAGPVGESPTRGVFEGWRF
jgi:hypothetical protein